MDKQKQFYRKGFFESTFENWTETENRKENFRLRNHDNFMMYTAGWNLQKVAASDKQSFIKLLTVWISTVSSTFSTADIWESSYIVW